jgi:hypothetical protein
MVECKDCIHFRRLPGDTTFRCRTGCYHPELMEQRLSERFLSAQDVPGDHTVINLHHDCAKFEPRPRKSLVARLFEVMRT